MTLTFSAGSHRYTYNGKSIPGVTTLLGKGLPKPAIPYWAARSVAEFVTDRPDDVARLREMGRAPMIAALKEVPWQARDDAAIKGTSVHAIAEQVIHGAGVEVPDYLADYVTGYVRFLDEFSIEPLLTEKSCVNRRFFYAGRFDAIVKLDGAITLMDLKTSKGVYGETSLQTAAYARTDAYVSDDDPDTEIDMPVIERIVVAHVREGETTLHDLGDIDRSFKIFTHIQFVAKQVDYIKGLVSDPLEPPTARDAA